MTARNGDPLEPLLRSIALRDTTAFEVLKKSVAARLFAIALRLLRNRADADEVVSDVFTRVWFSCNRFDPARGTVLSWLATICRNAAIDRLRHSQRADARSTIHSHDIVGVVSSPDVDLEVFETYGCLSAAIQRLPNPQRQYLSMSYGDGLSHRQISALCGVPLGTVKSHLNRTLKRLRRQMQLSGAEHGGRSTV